MAQKPNLLLFDEPESGVDLENMKLIGRTVHELLGGRAPADAFSSLRQQKTSRQVSGLIITHTGYILEYINADRGQVLYEGHLCCESNPGEILDHISRFGYQECIRCLK
jgi:Fe-S cluster assembly ATP-binding protein